MGKTRVFLALILHLLTFLLLLDPAPTAHKLLAHALERKTFRLFETRDNNKWICHLRISPFQAFS